MQPGCFYVFRVAALSLRTSIGKKEPEAGRRRSSLQAWRGFEPGYVPARVFSGMFVSCTAWMYPCVHFEM